MCVSQVTRMSGFNMIYSEQSRICFFFSLLNFSVPLCEEAVDILLCVWWIAIYLVQGAILNSGDSRQTLHCQRCSLRAAAGGQRRLGRLKGNHYK